MPKKPDERIEPAKQMYLDGMKLIDIAKRKHPDRDYEGWDAILL